MRQQEKQEQQKDQENRKQNLWARQYSDDVFIEDPLPTIKPRWGEIELYKNHRCLDTFLAENQILLFESFAHAGFICHCVNVLDKYDRQAVITIHFRMMGVWVVPHHTRNITCNPKKGNQINFNFYATLIWIYGRTFWRWSVTTYLCHFFLKLYGF